MSASNIQPAFSKTEWHLDLAYHATSRLSALDPSIDDPVDDTGLGPQRGDLHLSDNFARLVGLICEESGEFS